MKQLIFIFPAFLMFARPSFADPVEPLPPLEVGGFKVRAAIETIPLFVEAFERGFPLLTQDEEKDKGKEVPKPKPKEDSNDAAKILANLAKAQTDMNDALKKNLAEIKKRREDRLAGRAPAPEVKAPAAKVEEPAKPQAVEEEWNDKSWLNFCDCAKRSTPVLRAKRRAEFSSDKTVPLQLEALLTADRGNGKIVTSDGIACGKHLGPLGTRLADRNLELLFLTSLTNPSTEERFAPLWSTYRLWIWAQQAGEKAKALHFWDYVMQRNALRHLFSHEALPSLERHIKEYLAIYRNPGKDQKGKLVVQLSEKSFRETVDADLKNSATINYEAKPCEKE